MHKIGIVFSAFLIAGSSVNMTVAKAEKLPTIKLNLADTIKKRMGTRRIGYARPIRASATIVTTLKADLVTVNFGLAAQGDDAGSTITALSEKRNALVKAAKWLGFDTVEDSVTALNVRSRSNRAFLNRGNGQKAGFTGTMAVLLTFKTGQNGEGVLANIAKIAGDRVSRVGNMQFTFSEDDWEKQIAVLKKQALDKAHANAVEQASQQGRELKGIKNSQISNPRRNTRSRKQMVDVYITATVSYNVE